MICKICGKQVDIADDEDLCDDCMWDRGEAEFNRRADRQQGDRDDKEYDDN